MSEASKTKVEKSGRELLMERVFDAPRELVWKAFSEPQQIAQWWGPKGWTVPISNMDFRVGGTWHYCMRGPGGEESWGKAIYREIVEPQRFVYVDSFADAEGNSVPGMPETVITMEFTEQAGKTKITSRAEFASAEDLQAVLDMGMVEGLTETWDRLEEHLAKAA